MLRTMKWLGGPVVVTGIFAPVVYAKEVDSRCVAKPEDVYKEPKPRCRKQMDESTELEKCVQMCRQELKPLKEGVVNFVSNATNFVSETSTTIGENVDYLRKAPQEVQVAAIIGGTLVGSLLGLRRGIFRKIWYGTLGGLATAAIIYPDDTRTVARAGTQLVKCYGTIAYNFIAGPCNIPKKEACVDCCEPKQEETNTPTKPEGGDS